MCVHATPYFVILFAIRIVSAAIDLLILTLMQLPLLLYHSYCYYCYDYCYYYYSVYDYDYEHDCYNNLLLLPRPLLLFY